jgi:prolyl-tRNA synthetase
MEKAEALAPAGPAPAGQPGDGQDATPGKSTCADVAELLGVPLSRTVKSLVLATEELGERAKLSRPRSGCCCCVATMT